MSPRKAATAKAVVAKAVAAKAAIGKAVAKKTTDAKAAGAKAIDAKPAAQETGKTAANGTTSAEASALAAKIEHDLREGRSDTLTPQAFQALMAALCKSYGTQLEAGVQFLPLASQTSASPTEVMTTTSALLKAANLAVFELGMWQSWTGR
jgi:hypothetical protein